MNVDTIIIEEDRFIIDYEKMYNDFKLDIENGLKRLYKPKSKITDLTPNTNKGVGVGGVVACY